MRSASLIRYDIARLTKHARNPGLPYAWHEANKLKLFKLSAALKVAERRELKRLAKVLTYKADVYGPAGRIHSFEGKWTVREDINGNAHLFFNDHLIDPATLCDGHGRTIDADSNY